MKRELVVLMFTFILLISIFSFATNVIADDDDDSSESDDSESNSGSSNSNSENENSDDDSTTDESDDDSDDDNSIDEDDESDSNDDLDNENKGPSEKSKTETRTKTITRNGETFTLTQTREFTRTRNEDGSISEVKVRITEITNEAGEIIKRIGVEKTKEKSFGEDGEIEVETKLEVEEEVEGNNTKIKIKLSNDERKELKILPDQASEIARERLKARNLTKIELREKIRNNIPVVVYHIEGDKPGKFLGIFKFAMNVQTEIDPETGEVIITSKPWWAFLVAEDDETPDVPQNDTIGNETEATELCSELLSESACNLRDDCQSVFVLDENQLWQSCEDISVVA